jgi:nicotinic acid mononucleotide adenylyltransferase
LSAVSKYLSSFSSQLGLIMGALYYLAYAAPSHSWTDPWLIGVSVFISGFAPYYSKFSNRIDEKAAFHTASVFAGKLARFAAQVVFNVVVYSLLVRGTSVSEKDLDGLGGILGISATVSLISQGIQYLALFFYNRDVGSKNVNVTLGVTLSVAAGALAAQGFETAQTVLMGVGLVLAAVGLLYSLFTDVRGLLSPKGGVGLYFGTFNPAHKTHAAILRRFVEERQLERVIVHPTLIPKVHRIALAKGQIRIKEQSAGMRVYEATEKADVHVNYFTTGTRFYETEHRIAMLKIMVREEGLEDVVEVADMSDAYNAKGFYGVIRAVKKQYRGKKLHGLHGSDVGGMLVRSIYDESGGIIPCAIRRIDGISATAIRNGAQGMTTEGVEAYVRELKSEVDPGQARLSGTTA